MTSKPIRATPATPLPSCPDQPRCRELGVTRRVRFQRTAATEPLTIATIHGTVVAHAKGTVTVRCADGTTEMVSCGAVIPA